MSNALAKPPGKVQAIGIMHLIGGILNIFGALAWAAGGFLNGLMTFGIGCIRCLLLAPEKSYGYEPRK